MKLPSLLSIKKPCQYFYTSCKNSLQVTRFGKAPRDVNSIPSKILSATGKLVFYAFADESKGTCEVVRISDGDLASRCGSSRPSVIAGRRRLVEIGLIEPVGEPVNQVQAFRILHPMFAKSAYRRGHVGIDPEVEAPKKERRVPVNCPKCFKVCRSVMKVGWCRNCNTRMNTEKLVRRVVHEEIETITKAEESA